MRQLDEWRHHAVRNVARGRWRRDTEGLRHAAAARVLQRSVAHALRGVHDSENHGRCGRAGGDARNLQRGVPERPSLPRRRVHAHEHVDHRAGRRRVSRQQLDAPDHVDVRGCSRGCALYRVLVRFVDEQLDEPVGDVGADRRTNQSTRRLRKEQGARVLLLALRRPREVRWVSATDGIVDLTFTLPQVGGVPLFKTTLMFSRRSKKSRRGSRVPRIRRRRQ